METGKRVPDLRTGRKFRTVSTSKIKWSLNDLVRQESDFFLSMIKDNKNGMNHRRNCSVFKQNLGKIYNRAFWV